MNKELAKQKAEFDKMLKRIDNSMQGKQEFATEFTNRSDIAAVLASIFMHTLTVDKRVDNHRSYLASICELQDKTNDILDEQLDYLYNQVKSYAQQIDNLNAYIKKQSEINQALIEVINNHIKDKNLAPIIKASKQLVKAGDFAYSSCKQCFAKDGSKCKCAKDMARLKALAEGEND